MYNVHHMSHHFQDVHRNKHMNHEENEDWLVTKEVYAESVVTDDQCINPTIRLKISTINVVGIRRLPNSELSTISTTDDTILSRRFQFRKLEDSPVVFVEFQYDPDLMSPTSVHVSFCEYPERWPVSKKDEWNQWLNERSNQVLEDTQMSFSVCEYIEHEGLHFFNMVDKNDILGYSAVLFESFSHQDEPWSMKSGAQILDLFLVGNDVKNNIPSIQQNDKGKKKYSESNMTIETYARKLIRTKWKTWIRHDCPICFTDDVVSEMVELPCWHLLCKDCLPMYIKSIMDELKTCRHNPFICPIPTCKQDMEVLNGESSILSTQDKDYVSLWKKGLLHPPTNFLTTCPRKSCKSRSMLQLNTTKLNTLVFCDDCGATYCELCLEKPNTSAEDHANQCDPKPMMRLCRKYHLAEPSIQEKCEERWHWLKDYAKARGTANDISAQLWVTRNAQTCPTCNFAIERSDGCFHMQCSICGTHFCYECGDEIFYPYYGTHHCWEEDDEEEDEGEFIGFFDPRYDFGR